MVRIKHTPFHVPKDGCGWEVKLGPTGCLPVVWRAWVLYPARTLLWFAGARATDQQVVGLWYNKPLPHVEEERTINSRHVILAGLTISRLYVI